MPDSGHRLVLISLATLSCCVSSVTAGSRVNSDLDKCRPHEPVVDIEVIARHQPLGALEPEPRHPVRVSRTMHEVVPDFNASIATITPYTPLTTILFWLMAVLA